MQENPSAVGTPCRTPLEEITTFPQAPYSWWRGGLAAPPPKNPTPSNFYTYASCLQHLMRCQERQSGAT